MSKFIAVDLDGTLAESTTDGSIGKPVKAMADRVKGWTKDGLSVVIFTARGGSADQISRIKAWLKQHELPDLDVTNIKEVEMVEFWDNKAVRVEVDSGEVCKTCDSFRKNADSISKKYSGRFTTDC